jgi:hypothetical protein
MGDRYYDPEGWKKRTLRSLLEFEQGLWLICRTCQKSRDFDAAEWAAKHRVDLDVPLKTLEKAIRCQRCGTRGGDHGVGAYGQPYSIASKPQPRRIDENDPICPRCGQTTCKADECL